MACILSLLPKQLLWQSIICDNMSFEDLAKLELAISNRKYIEFLEIFRDIDASGPYMNAMLSVETLPKVEWLINRNIRFHKLGIEVQEYLANVVQLNNDANISKKAKKDYIRQMNISKEVIRQAIALESILEMCPKLIVLYIQFSHDYLGNASVITCMRDKATILQYIATKASVKDLETIIFSVTIDDIIDLVFDLFPQIKSFEVEEILRLFDIGSLHENSKNENQSTVEMPTVNEVEDDDDMEDDDDDDMEGDNEEDDENWETDSSDSLDNIIGLQPNEQAQCNTYSNIETIISMQCWSVELIKKVNLCPNLVKLELGNVSNKVTKAMCSYPMSSLTHLVLNFDLLHRTSMSTECGHMISVSCPNLRYMNLLTGNIFSLELARSLSDVTCKLISLKILFSTIEDNAINELLARPYHMIEELSIFRSDLSQSVTSEYDLQSILINISMKVGTERKGLKMLNLTKAKLGYFDDLKLIPEYCQFIEDLSISIDGFGDDINQYVTSYRSNQSNNNIDSNSNSNSNTNSNSNSTINSNDNYEILSFMLSNLPKLRSLMLFGESATYEILAAIACNSLPILQYIKLEFSTFQLDNQNTKIESNATTNVATSSVASVCSDDVNDHYCSMLCNSMPSNTTEKNRKNRNSRNSIVLTGLNGIPMNVLIGFLSQFEMISKVIVDRMHISASKTTSNHEHIPYCKVKRLILSQVEASYILTENKIKSKSINTKNSKKSSNSGMNAGKLITNDVAIISLLNRCIGLESLEFYECQSITHKTVRTILENSYNNNSSSNSSSDNDSNNIIGENDMISNKLEHKRIKSLIIDTIKEGRSLKILREDFPDTQILLA